MKYGTTIIAFVLMGLLPALAGSATYKRPGSDLVDAAIQTCQPKITDATNALVSMRLQTNDPKAKQIMHELGQARDAMGYGRAQECLAHVSNAVGLEH